jgi:hypothetical protein
MMYLHILHLFVNKPPVAMKTQINQLASSSPCQRPCNLLPSLVVRHLSVFTFESSAKLLKQWIQMDPWEEDN